mgnify:CR=1 FL=1
MLSSSRGKLLDFPIALIGGTIAGSVAVLVALAWLLRRPRREPPRRTIAAARYILDPLAPLWSDLDSAVAEDPDLDSALDDLNRFLADPEPEGAWPATSAPGALDAEARDRAEAFRVMLRNLLATRTTARPDSLRVYLEDLEKRDETAAVPIAR